MLISFKKGILTRAMTWMNFEDMLNKITQAQRDKYCKISTYLRYLSSVQSLSHVQLFATP